MRPYSNYSPDQIRLFQATAVNVNARKTNHFVDNSKYKDSQHQKSIHIMTNDKPKIPSPMKISFSYSLPHRPEDVHNAQQKGFSKNKKQNQKSNQKKQKKMFLNVISKKQMPQHIKEFVFGHNLSTINSSKGYQGFQMKSRPMLSDIQANQQQKNLSQNLVSPQKVIQVALEEQTFQSILNSKIKKSRRRDGNCSTQRSQQKNGEFPKNGGKQPMEKFQLQEIQLQKQFKIVIPTEISKLEWNDTVKFNNINKMSKLVENQQSTAANLGTNKTEHNNSGQNLNLSNTDKQNQSFSLNQVLIFRDKNDGTQKISEFLICEEDESAEICEFLQNKVRKNNFKKLSQDIAQHESQTFQSPNLSRMGLKRQKDSPSLPKVFQNYSQVPIFQMSLSDLNQPILQCLQFIQNSGYKFKNIQIYQKLQNNLSVLDKNVKQLAFTIQNICQRTVAQNQQNMMNESLQNSILQYSSKSVENIMKEQTEKPFQVNSSLKIIGQNCQNENLSQNTNRNHQVLEQQQLDQTKECHYDEFSCNPQNSFRQDGKLLGSLVVVESKDNIQNNGENFDHIYGKTRKNCQENLNLQQQIYKLTKPYNQTLFPQSQVLTSENLIQFDQLKMSEHQQSEHKYYSNYLDTYKYSSKLQNQKGFTQGQKQSQIQSEGQNGMSTQSNFKDNEEYVRPETQRLPTIPEFQYKIIDNYDIRQQLIPDYSDIDQPFVSKKLNYELFRIYKEKHFEKKQTKFVLTKSKLKYIELPYMQNPYQKNSQGSKFPKYIKNKVYYVKV